MRIMSVIRAQLLIAVTASVAACGFDPQPKSGVVACKPGGAACCPEGYICVGRGAITAAGPSPGSCWYKEDLPLPALAATHDYTPTLPNDPACLVTDWVPPGTGGAGGTLDAGTAGVDGVIDTGWMGSGGVGGAGAGVDSGPDAPLVQDTARDVATGAGGADGGGTGTDGGAGDSTGRDGVAVDAPAVDSRDAARDVALDMPVPLIDAAFDVSGPEVSATWDSPPDIVTGGEDAGVDVGASTVRTITSIAAGDDHTCAAVNGAALCWGDNYEGELGDSTTTARKYPVQAVGLESGVTAVAASMRFSCAVVNGGAKCWGSGDSGQLGDNSTASTYRLVPVQVVGLESGVTAISTGSTQPVPWSTAGCNAGATTRVASWATTPRRPDWFLSRWLDWIPASPPSPPAGTTPVLWSTTGCDAGVSTAMARLATTRRPHGTFRSR